jgi:hypothetical protein
MVLMYCHKMPFSKAQNKFLTKYHITCAQGTTDATISSNQKVGEWPKEDFAGSMQNTQRVNRLKAIPVHEYNGILHHLYLCKQNDQGYIHLNEIWRNLLPEAL